MMRLVSVGLVCLLASGAQAAQTDSSESAQAKLTVRTRNDQTTFHIGELIELELSFTSGAVNPPQINTATSDHSGRLGLESYTIEPNTGWDDPLELFFQSYGGFVGGGMFGLQKLSPKPAIIRRDMNEAVRFLEPGRYRLTVGSSRAKVELQELWLTIIPATAEWQAATLEKALAVIDDPHPPAATGDSNPVRTAVATLRYLGTPGAAAAMARRLNDQNSVYQYKLGLAATPAKEAVLKTMEQLLSDPTFPVNGFFIEAMSLVALPATKTSNRPQERIELEAKFRRQLLETLGRKRGAALSVSAYTVVDEAAMHLRDLPPDQKQRLTAELIKGFDGLPPQAQMELFQSRWQVLDQSAMLELLPTIARRYKEFPQLREFSAYQANEVSAGALTRWWQLDPQSARSAMIEEIVRPKPRFGTSVLGALPDKELPEADQPLADHLTAEKGSEEQIASLIARYATPAIQSQVVGFLQERVGKWACAIQAPLLAYLLRVDSVGTAPLLEKAMAARGPGSSACNHSLLVEVAELHNDPALEDLAQRSLDDSDPQIVANAATYLGKYGSPTAEEKLWNRLAAWSRQWKGRAEEFHYVAGEKMDGIWEEGSGSNMISALATGQNWMIDEAKLGRLIDLSVSPNQRQQAEQFLSTSKARPHGIRFTSFGGAHFQIEQYSSLSFPFAVEKLIQFPAGTNFMWWGDPTPESDKAFEAVSKAVAGHEIKIVKSPAP